MNNISEIVPNDNGTFDVYSDKKYKGCEWGDKEFIGETTSGQNAIKFDLNIIG